MLNRKQKETLIYRHKAKDYKGRIEGKKSVMPPVNFIGKTCLVVLSNLSDEELERLWEMENENNYLLRKEEQRKAK
jgi:hypothetical protein